MLNWIRPDWSAPAHVHALMTTRHGGVSTPPYAALNLAHHVGDDPANVARNRQLLRQLLPADPFWLNQVHGIQVIAVDYALQTPAADASYTRVTKQVCAVLTADCLPVFFCTPDGDQVALAHAGWRGLAAGVLEATLNCLTVNAKVVKVWLGAGIGAQAFEVGAEVRSQFVTQSSVYAAAFRPADRPQHWHADLAELARLRLQMCGVSEISGGNFCTYSESDRFYSYRRDAKTGRMASLIWFE
jgi:polyphenol oxidase